MKYECAHREEKKSISSFWAVLTWKGALFRRKGLLKFPQGKEEFRAHCECILQTEYASRNHLDLFLLLTFETQILVAQRFLLYVLGKYLVAKQEKQCVSRQGVTFGVSAGSRLSPLQLLFFFSSGTGRRAGSESGQRLRRKIPGPGRLYRRPRSSPGGEHTNPGPNSMNGKLLVTFASF